MKTVTRLAVVRWSTTTLLLWSATTAPLLSQEETEDADLLAVTQLLDAARPTASDGFEYSADRFVDHVDGDSLVLEGNAVVLHRGARLEAARMVFFRDRHMIAASGVRGEASVEADSAGALRDSTVGIVVLVDSTREAAIYTVGADSAARDSNVVEFRRFGKQPEPQTTVTPKYPDIARKAGITGTVQVEVLVDKEGRVQSIGSVTGPEVFHEAATRAAARWTFSPAMQNDKPVRVWVMLPFRFTLGERADRRRPRELPPVTRPRLSRGEDILEGDVILYDTHTGEGWITEGRIAHDDGYFSGHRIRALSEEEFLVGQGSYTTCDADHPHFDFYSPRIKVRVGDMAIARPVYFRIAENRLLWIPFYVFSLREDRQSGMLTPGFGRRPLSFGSAATEWEVRNLGYYFAPNDYWDLTLAADLRQQTGWVGRAAMSYAWRYHFNGSVEGRIQNQQNGNVSQRAWWLSLRHRQQLGDSASLQGSGTFQGQQDFQRNNGIGLDDRLNRTLRSNLRYDKRWRDAGWSLSAGASQTKNLDTDVSDVVLPEISLRASRKALFGDAGRDGPWYTRVYYDGSAKLRNSRQTTPSSQTDRTRGEASVRLSTQQRPADWLNLNSSFSSGWRDQNLRRGSEEGLRTDRFTTSATVSQTVYGLFHPRIGRVTALRHVVKPDVGLSFAATRADSGGIGFSGRGRPWDANRRLTMRLSNSLWIKYLQGPDAEEEAKSRIAQLNLSTSYDFDRDTRPLSDLVTSLTVEGGRRLNSRLSLRSEFYDDDDRLRRLPRLRQFEVTTTLRTVGDRSRSSRSDDSERSRSRSLSAGVNRDDEFGFESGLQEDIEDRDRGRTFLLRHYFSHRRTSFATTRRSWLRAQAGMTVARTWHVNYSINYNLHDPDLSLTHRDRITAELLSIQREFHDWTATLNVEPSRLVQDRAFYFKAQFKEIPQLRFERGDRRRVGS